MIAGGTLYATTAIPASVLAFDLATGTPIFATAVGGSPGSMAVAAGGLLIVPNIQGWVDFIQ